MGEKVEILSVLSTDRAKIIPDILMPDVYLSLSSFSSYRGFEPFDVFVGVSIVPAVLLFIQSAKK